MCGRTKLETPDDELRTAFGLDEVPEMPPRYNIAPTQPIAVVRQALGQPRRMDLVRWGLILPNARGGPGINARIETVMRAPQYRESFRKRRCLVVVDGFYEWQRRGDVKQPFAIVRADRKAFALAGIWAEGVTKDGEVIDTCAIITGEPAGIVATLHDRMPLVIAPSNYTRWLDPQSGDVAELVALLQRDATDLTAYAVAKLVNSPDNEGPGCASPIPPEAEVHGSGALFG